MIFNWHTFPTCVSSFQWKCMVFAWSSSRPVFEGFGFLAFKEAFIHHSDHYIKIQSKVLSTHKLLQKPFISEATFQLHNFYFKSLRILLFNRLFFLGFYLWSIDVAGVNTEFLQAETVCMGFIFWSVSCFIWPSILLDCSIMGLWNPNRYSNYPIWDFIYKYNLVPSLYG